MSAQPSFLGLARRSFWLLFGGIWCVVGVGMLIGAGAFAIQESEFARGSTATGVVLSKDITPADSDSSTQYSVRYRFTTAAGETVEGRADVGVETWEALVERGPLEVRYVPERPSSNRLEAGPDPVGFLIFALFGIVFGGIGGALVVRAVRGILRARRLLTAGRPVSATVLGVEMTNVRINRRNQFRIRYTYPDAHGRTHEGESDYLDWEQAGDWQVGDVGLARVDPNRPDDSLWVGRATAAVDGDGTADVVDAAPAAVPTESRPPASPP